MQQKKSKVKEGKKKNSKIEKPKDVGHFLVQNFDFCACPSQNVVKRDASGKKGKLLCCKCLLDHIEANLAKSSLKTTKMSKKRFFDKTLRESMG